MATLLAADELPSGRRMPGVVTLANRQLPVTISHISPDGCFLEGAGDWGNGVDFLRLSFDCGFTINGRVSWSEGTSARIGFYGQLNPLAIAKACRWA